MLDVGILLVFKMLSFKIVTFLVWKKPSLSFCIIVIIGESLTKDILVLDIL
jgi:hypothetical protein